TLVGCNKLCVDPHGCPVVYCAAMQEKPLPPVFRRNAEGTTIPYNRMKAGIANAAGRRLRGKGYLDRMGVDIDTFLPPLVKTLPAIIVGKVPGPSKINPAGTGKLWTWMNYAILFLHSHASPINLSWSEYWSCNFHGD